MPTDVQTNAQGSLTHSRPRAHLTPPTKHKLPDLNLSALSLSISPLLSLSLPPLLSPTRSCVVLCSGGSVFPLLFSSERTSFAAQAQHTSVSAHGATDYLLCIATAVYFAAHSPSVPSAFAATTSSAPTTHNLQPTKPTSCPLALPFATMVNMNTEFVNGKVRAAACACLRACLAQAREEA